MIVEAFLVIAVLWCFFWGFFGAYVASEKGRSVGEGITFAIIFGPLGLIIVACLPTLAAEEQNTRVAARAARWVDVDPPGVPIPTTVGAARAADQSPPKPALAPAIAIREVTTQIVDRVVLEEPPAGRYGTGDWEHFRATQEGAAKRKKGSDS